MTPLAQQMMPHLPWQASHWWLGISGGLDSMCLMALIHDIQKASTLSPQDCPALPPITVLHINHGLNSQASDWAHHVAQVAKQYNLPCITHTVQLDPEMRAAQGEESSARHARYQAFSHYIDAGQALLLAHHANDQAETLLLRLLRGTGVKGLGSIPDQRSLVFDDNINNSPINPSSHTIPATVVRPLLSFNRSMLEDYAQQANLTWCDDPSNANDNFDRNFIRHKVMPKLYKRWPSFAKKAQETAHIMQDTQILLEDLAKLDSTNLGIYNEEHDTLTQTTRLPINALLLLSYARRHNLLRWWLSNHGVKDINHTTHTAIEQLFHVKPGAQPLVILPSGVLRYAKGHIVWLTNANHTHAQWQEEEWTWNQVRMDQTRHPVANGHLTATDVNTVGLRVCVGDTIQIKHRQGGERCHPQQREHSQSLKKVLQELNIPAWQRHSLPLFYVNGELAMVGDLFVCREFTTQKGEIGWLWHDINQ